MKHLYLILPILLFSCKKECNEKCGDVIAKEVTSDQQGIVYVITYVTECGDTIPYRTTNINLYAHYEVNDQICLQ